MISFSKPSLPRPTIFAFSFSKPSLPIISPDRQSLRQVWERDIGHVSFIHLADNSTCRKYIELGMAFSRLELKIISIIQLVMSVILFALGIVDHFEVRYTYLSHLLMPCWIAALVCTLAQDTQLRMFYCLRSCF